MNMKANAVKSNRSISKGAIRKDSDVDDTIEMFNKYKGAYDDVMTVIDLESEKSVDPMRTSSAIDRQADSDDLMVAMDDDLEHIKDIADRVGHDYRIMANLHDDLYYAVRGMEGNVSGVYNAAEYKYNWSRKKSVRKSAIRKDHVIDSWLSPDQIGFESGLSDGEWNYSAVIPTGDGEGISIYFMIDTSYDGDSVRIAYAVDADSMYCHPIFNTHYYSWNTDDGPVVVDSIDEAKEWIADFINKLRANIANSTSGSWSSRKSIIKSRRL